MGERTKTTPDQTFQTKNPRTKPPRTIEREFVQRAFVRGFVLGLLKNRGSEMCDVLLGGPGMCDRGRGLKLAKNSVMYFMDGPWDVINGCSLNAFWSTLCLQMRRRA